MLIREIYQIRISWTDETKNIFQCFRNYIFDGYNILDFFGQILYLVYSISNLTSENSKKFIEYLHVVALLLLFIRGISQLRIYESTRYLIRMITEVIIGMIPFLIVLFFSTIAFAIIFNKIHKLERENNKIKGNLDEIPEIFIRDQIYFSFKLAILGDFEDFEDKLENKMNFLVFVLTSILQLIVMLNLLIAVISDTFDKV